MNVFLDFLKKIENIQNRAKTESVLEWVKNKYPQLVPKIAWNQPMFTDHETFIIAFSVAKNHMSIAPEGVTITKFSDEIQQSGYEYTKELFKIRWDKDVDFELLGRIIEFNISEKESCTTFWRQKK